MARSGNEQSKRHARRAVLALVCALVSLPLGSAQARPGADRDHRVLLRDVTVRPGVTVDVNLEVFVNERHPCQGKDVLAVPGFAHNAATWKPLAEAAFEEGRQEACRVIAIDLPGHGGSGLPEGGLIFGELTLDDDVTVLRGSLERMRALGIRPDVLMGHSQGALLIQMLQQTLADGGTSLRRRFGIGHVVLLAPVAPQAIPWAFVDNGTAATLLQQFLAFDPARGTHVAIPDPFWPFVFFSDLSGSIVPGAPDPAQVAARGFNGPEPLFSALQLVGAPPFARPSVDAGIFGARSRTELEVASFAQDTIVSAAEAAMLYEYLTGDGTRAGVVEVSGAYSVHDMYISDPRTVLAELTDPRP